MSTFRHRIQPITPWVPLAPVELVPQAAAFIARISQGNVIVRRDASGAVEATVAGVARDRGQLWSVRPTVAQRLWRLATMHRAA